MPVSRIRLALRRIQPGWLRALRRSFHNYKILNATLGQFATMRRERCVDATGEPIPWLTYSAIEFLKQLNFSSCSVFEYGSGASTLFWAKRAQSIISVEDSPAWHQSMKDQMPSNVQYFLRESREEYAQAINAFRNDFEVIIVDGVWRYDCAVMARPKLHPNGCMIVDNSDWMPKTCAFLRNSDLIQVDMSGFGPINAYTWTTSFFLSRQVKLTPLYDRQPVPGPGCPPTPDPGVE
jgi:hypothetical protein